MSPLGPGDRAPDAVVMDGDGEPRTLSDAWRAEPAVLVFLRYFGCPFCQAQVVGLREDRERFAAAGANVVLVGQGTPAECREFCDRRQVPFEVLVDPTRAAFRAFDLPTAHPLQIAHPSVVTSWAKAMQHAETRQRGLRGGSFFQMPGTFIVEPTGVVRFAHRNRHLADTPRNQVLLAELGRLAGATDGTRPA